MAVDELHARVDDVVAAVDRRTVEVVDALRRLGEDELRAPSVLPGWDRLTVVCHLRYGAQALARMTAAAVAGQPVSYYPEGRDRQRPLTLEPRAGESPAEAVSSLHEASARLHARWAGMDGDAWQFDVVEPARQVDLGTLPLVSLPLLRLTEVEVHGSDLDLALAPWSDVFVGVALPFRLGWLNRRRTNHRAVDAGVQGSWLLAATDGPTWRVAVDGERVDSRPADAATPARAVIEASSRDLLALLLGRPLDRPPRYAGDRAFAGAFTRAFPGP